MKYQNTFFQVDPMVIFKQTSEGLTKVIRLDEDFVLELEDHIAVAWKMLTERKSLNDVFVHFNQVCGLNEEESKEVLNKLTATLIDQKLGTLGPMMNEAT